MKRTIYIIMCGLMTAVISCTEAVDNATVADRQPDIFPDYVGVTIPSTIAPMNFSMADDADSYHNWSIGSHWFVFTSRRNDGLYSHLYLSCIDDHGKATKAFLLPQKNPKEYYTSSLYSFNTPDFTSKPVELDSRQAAKDIISDKRTETSVRRQTR